MNTDIIVPIHNQLEYTKLFINSLSAQKDWNLIIIDNGSDVETQNYLRSIKGNVKIIRNETNKGYVRAVNQGLKIITSDSILLANNAFG